jgi:hypothetical protein
VGVNVAVAVAVGVNVAVAVGVNVAVAVAVGVNVAVAVGVNVAVAVAVGVNVAVAVAVAVGVNVAVGVAVGVGDGDPQGPPRRLLSTTFVSPVTPSNPPTTSRRFPIAVPPVKECATFVFGPVIQLLLIVS